MEMQFNPVTLKNEVNNYDNSFAILLLSVIALVIIASLVVATMMVVQSNYLLQQQKAAGKKPNSFRQDINCYLNEKFYVTLLTLPVLGVVVFTIVSALHFDRRCLYELRPAAHAACRTVYMGRAGQTLLRCLAASRCL